MPITITITNDSSLPLTNMKLEFIPWITGKQGEKFECTIDEKGKISLDDKYLSAVIGIISTSTQMVAHTMVRENDRIALKPLMMTAYVAGGERLANEKLQIQVDGQVKPIDIETDEKGRFVLDPQYLGRSIAPSSTSLVRVQSDAIMLVAAGNCMRMFSPKINVGTQTDAVILDPILPQTLHTLE